MALSVFLNAVYVGELWLDERRRFVFQYASTWLVLDQSIPLSLSLPLQKAPFTDDVARPFFSNLLPESRLRAVIARRLGLSEKNDYGLLEAVGGECAGAVSLLSQGQKIEVPGSYKKLSHDELHELVARMERRPMLAGERGIRLSLAGVQNKLPVFFDGKFVSLPQGALPSSHILKPAINEYSTSVFNEAFCMRLAKAVGLPTPDVALLESQGDWLYLVSRYDRVNDERGALQRLHQEDFCQALGILSESKYEKEGGPGLADCFELIRHKSIQPVADLRHLLNWVVFNYLIGNADAHGKNISLLLTRQGPTLAPFYDLMSTVIYGNLTDKFAMKIGGEDRPKWIIADSWEKLGAETGVGFNLIKQTLFTMGEKLLASADRLKAELSAVGPGSSTVDDVMKVVNERNNKMKKVFLAAGL